MAYYSKSCTSVSTVESDLQELVSEVPGFSVVRVDSSDFVFTFKYNDIINIESIDLATGAGNVHVTICTDTGREFIAITRVTDGNRLISNFVMGTSAGNTKLEMSVGNTNCSMWTTKTIYDAYIGKLIVSGTLYDDIYIAMNGRQAENGATFTATTGDQFRNIGAFLYVKV